MKNWLKIGFRITVLVLVFFSSFSFCSHDGDHESGTNRGTDQKISEFLSSATDNEQCAHGFCWHEGTTMPLSEKSVILLKKSTPALVAQTVTFLVPIVGVEHIALPKEYLLAEKPPSREVLRC